MPSADRIDRVTEVGRQLGVNVRRAREGRGWTQAQLAAAIGCEPRTVQRLEAGETGQLAGVVAAADALGVPVASLFRVTKAEPRRAPGRPPRRPGRG